MDKLLFPRRKVLPGRLWCAVMGMEVAGTSRPLSSSLPSMARQMKEDLGDVG